MKRQPVDLIHPLLRAYLESPEAVSAELRWGRQFRRGVERAAAPPTQTGFWICMTPRSGSTWLASMLEQTRVLGRPHEYLALELPFIERNPSADFEDFLLRVQRMSATRNGVFGIKANGYQVAPLVRRGLFRPPDAPRHYIYLTREDLVRQGVSLYRAMESGAWTPRTPSTGAAAFDASKILWWTEWLIQMMGAWETIFAAHGITPLRITYEDLRRDPMHQVRRIASHVGIDPGTLAKSDPDAFWRGGPSPERETEADDWVDRLRSVRLEMPRPR